MKILLKILGLLLSLILSTAGTIRGLWKTIDEETEKPRALVAVYGHQGRFYGRIIGTYNRHGYLADTIYHPKSRAEGIVDNPHYCGLDIIWDLKKKGDKYFGRICDPEKGRVYDAEVWREGPDLIVRGKLFFFGRNQRWLKTTNADLPNDFKRPELKDFIPVIPMMKR